jgi:hypothetical protein
MLSTATRGSLMAALLLSVAVTGCLGDDGGAAGVFRKLERRPSELRSGDHVRRIGEHGTAGGCLEDIGVGAIALPATPGWAALGPWPGLAQLKRGPVYAALVGGAPRIVFLSGLPAIGESRWRAVRTIWVSRPSYDGPVLVRGGRLDRPGDLGFGSRARPRKELRLPSGSWPPGAAARVVEEAPKGWRATGVPARIRAPGCYAFQVDGLGFSYVLAFGVQ